MGAGASTNLPSAIDKPTARRIAGGRFDNAAFERAAKNGVVTRDDFESALMADAVAIDFELFVAAQDGNTEEATRLLAAGASPDEHKNAVRLVCAAASCCCAPPFTHLPCAPHRCLSWQDGNTALMRAGTKGHTAIVKALVDAGADVNAKNRVRLPLATRSCASPLAHPPCAPHRCPTWKDGSTALILASGNGYTKNVQVLLGAGADVNAKKEVRPPHHSPPPLLRAAARSPAVCAAPLLHLAGWQHRPYEGQRQRSHGEHAGPAGRGGRRQ